MKKIERVINNCTDCRFLRTYEWPCTNYNYLDVCFFENENSIFSPFVLAIRTNRDVHIIEIPSNCPLENYIKKQES